MTIGSAAWWSAGGSWQECTRGITTAMKIRSTSNGCMPSADGNAAAVARDLASADNAPSAGLADADRAASTRDSAGGDAADLNADSVADAGGCSTPATLSWSY